MTDLNPPLTQEQGYKIEQALPTLEIEDMHPSTKQTVRNVEDIHRQKDR